MATTKQARRFNLDTTKLLINADQSIEDALDAVAEIEAIFVKYPHLTEEEVSCTYLDPYNQDELNF